MDTGIETLVACLLPTYLIWALINTRFINKQVKPFSTLAEVTAWITSVIAMGIISLWGFGKFQFSQTFAILPDNLLGVRLDSLSILMFSLISILGLVLVRFSKTYLAGDENQGYFLKWLMLTIGSVIALVLSPGLFQFALAWTLMSLGLHKLLIYFPDRLGTLLSARKKFLISRIGDLCLGIAFIGIFSFSQTQDFGKLFQLIQTGTIELTSFPRHITWLIVAGAILKSAQFPFHTWLPDTMGTPTPVSALMHAGIINAGGFLIVRLSPLFIAGSGSLRLLAIVGFITAIFGAVVMMTQTSIKKMLAYSTIAQMGFMLLQCGLGAFHLAVLHIIAHSFYKAHAFLSSGSGIQEFARGDNKSPAIDFETKTWITHSLITLSIIGFSLLVLSYNPIAESGRLLFIMFVAGAVFHWINKSCSKSYKAKNILIAGAFTITYLALSNGMAFLLQGSSNVHSARLSATEIALSLLSFILFVGLFLFNKKKQSLFFDKLYVHALNGFYFNTIANRFARKTGMVPSGR